MWKQFPEKYTNNKSKAKKYQFVLETYLVPLFMDHYCMNMKKSNSSYHYLSASSIGLSAESLSQKYINQKFTKKPGSHVDRGVIVLPNFINHQQKNMFTIEKP